MPYDLIIFDCDGTLVDSEYLNLLAILEILHAHGQAQYTMEHGLSEFTGLRFSAILRMVSAETGYHFPDCVAQDFLKAVARLTPDYMKPIAGASEMVAQASSQTQICVASNGERNNVLNALKFAGLDKYFPDEAVYTALMVDNPKPAPDLFLHAAAQHSVDPARCLVIEDSIAGVSAGVAAGMEVWGFSGTHHDPQGQGQALIHVGASNSYSSMAEMVRVFS